MPALCDPRPPVAGGAPRPYNPVFAVPEARETATRGRGTMKPGIHPDYKVVTVHCACGATWQTRSTNKELRQEICSNCHPFFTGKQKLLDTAGRVERYNKKFAGRVVAPPKPKKVVAPPKPAAPKKEKVAKEKPAKKDKAEAKPEAAAE